MPRAAPEPTPQLQPEPKPALEPEPMDIPEMAAEHEMAFEPHREAEQEKQTKEDEECITLRRSDLLHFQDTLVDIRSQIRDVRSQFIDFQRDVQSQFADFQRDACQDKLEVQEMFRAIMDRLPSASGPYAPPPAP
jgi:hypothetical protein